MREGMDRRRFLRWMGTGAAVVSVPALTSGCAARSALLHHGPAPASDTYFSRFGVDAPILRRTLEKALGRGGDFSEVFLQHQIIHMVMLKDGQVDQAYTRVSLGAGIRVLKGDATGYAYCEELGEEALLAAADTASAVADSGGSARPTALAAVPTPNRYPVAVPWSEVGIDRKMPIVQRAEQVARAHDKRIIKVTARMSDATSRILIANSEGRLLEDDQPMALLVVSCVARDGDRTETAGESRSARAGMDFFSPQLIAEVSQHAADKTVALFEAIPSPVGELPVVLAAGRSGILLHEAIGHGMEADFNRKGESVYADMIGRQVASKDVTIVDDGTNGRQRGSINIDDEGIEGQRTVLVEKGILRSYLHDRISSRYYGVAPTGSGRRQDFRFPPIPRMRNTYMVSGPMDPDEIIASVDRGIYAETFSNGQVDIGPGDFTFFVTHGRMIEKGKLTQPIKDVNLIGNGPKVLETIDMVGNDHAMFSGAGSCGKDGQYIPVGFGLPTVRAGAISIGGRTA